MFFPILLTHPLALFVALVFAHCFLDYAGQGDFMAKAKNPKTAIPGIPWQTVLAAHAFMHAAAVYFLTGVWLFFVIELLGHAFADHLKSKQAISFNQDQFYHVIYKANYVLVLMLPGPLFKPFIN